MLQVLRACGPYNRLAYGQGLYIRARLVVCGGQDLIPLMGKGLIESTQTHMLGSLQVLSIPLPPQ